MPPALSVCLITMTVGRIFTALLCSAIAFAQDSKYIDGLSIQFKKKNWFGQLFFVINMH